MTELIVEYLKQGVNLFLNGLIIILMVSTFALVSVFATAINKQEVANKKLQEVAEFNQYDSKDVRGSDVVAAVMEYREYLDIQVYSENNTSALVVSTTNCKSFINPGVNVDAAKILVSEDYKLSILCDKVALDGKYMATLCRGSNDEVVGIKFVAQP